MRSMVNRTPVGSSNPGTGVSTLRGSHADMGKSKEELVVIAQQKLINLRPKAVGTASFGGVDELGHSHEDLYSLNAACHQGGPAFVLKYEGVILYTITTGSATVINVPEDIKLKYFEWLCSSGSPWADCLNNGLNTDPKFVADYGLLITDMDKLGKNLVIAALSASRACYEHPNHIIMWDRLAGSGLDPRWAFFLAGCTTSTANGVFYGMRSNQNHWPLHPWSASELYVKNYLSQTVTFDEVPFSSAASGTSVGGVWGPRGDFVATNYGASCYSTSKYWDNLKLKAGFNGSTGGWDSSDSTTYKDFLTAATQELERLQHV